MSRTRSRRLVVRMSRVVSVQSLVTLIENMIWHSEKSMAGPYHLTHNSSKYNLYETQSS